MSYKLLSGDVLKLDVVLHNNDLQIMTENREDVAIETPSLRRNSAEEAFRIEIINEVLIIKEQDVRRPSGLGFNSGGEIILRVPAKAKIEGAIVTYNGDIEIEEISFNGLIKTHNGDISIEELNSKKLEISVASGDTSIPNGHFQEVSIKALSGDIEIGNAHFDLICNSNVSTISGDIQVEIVEYIGNNTLLLQSVSGDIEINGNYPKDKVLSQTVSGDVTNNDFSVNFEGIVGDVAKKIKRKVKEAISGNTDDRGDVIRVLDMLDAGKIDADKAEQLIKAMRG